MVGHFHINPYFFLTFPYNTIAGTFSQFQPTTRKLGYFKIIIINAFVAYQHLFLSFTSTPYTRKLIVVIICLLTCFKNQHFLQTLLMRGLLTIYYHRSHLHCGCSLHLIFLPVLLYLSNCYRFPVGKKPTQRPLRRYRRKKFRLLHRARRFLL